MATSSGFFGFLKGIFKKEEIEQESVQFESLEEWFNTKSKIISERAEEIFKSSSNAVEEKIAVLLEIVNNLEKAELHNPNIPLKEKQFMEGNRKAYVNAVRNFAEWISFPGIAGFEEFLLKFKKELEWFGKRTIKQYQILQHFFANETRDIAGKVKEIEDAIVNTDRELKKEGLQKAEQIKKDIKDMKEKMSTKKGLRQELKEKEELLESVRKELSEIQDSIEEAEQSEEYRSLGKMREEKAAVEIKMKEKESDFSHIFSVIEMALKKYNKIAIEDNMVIESYLDDPVRAAVNDLGFKILRVLEKLEKAVNAGEVELKDKKKEKTLESIGKLDRDYLGGFLSDYNKLMTEKNLIAKKMRKNDVEQRLEIFRRKVTEKEEEIKVIEGEVVKLKESIVGISVVEMKEELEKKISKVLNMDVKVVV